LSDLLYIESLLSPLSEWSNWCGSDSSTL